MLFGNAGCDGLLPPILSQVEEISAAISHKKVAEVSRVDGRLLLGEMLEKTVFSSSKPGLAIWSTLKRCLWQHKVLCIQASSKMAAGGCCACSLSLQGEFNCIEAASDTQAVSDTHAACLSSLQAESSDPLEKFCDDNPDADECR